MTLHASTFAARISTGVISILMALAICAQAAPPLPDTVESLYRQMVKFDLEAPALQAFDVLPICAAMKNAKLMAQTRSKADAGDAHAQVVMGMLNSVGPLLGVPQDCQSARCFCQQTA